MITDKSRLNFLYPSVDSVRAKTPITLFCRARKPPVFVIKKETNNCPISYLQEKSIDSTNTRKSVIDYFFEL